MIFAVKILVYLAVSIILIEYAFALLLKAMGLVYLRHKSKHKLILTYDDGPGNRLEPRLLDIFRAYNVKATFFLNAKRAENFPNRCTVLKEEGHELGFHAYEHLNGWKVPQWISIRDMLKTRSVLSGWVGRTGFLRFAYGNFTTSMWLTSILLGLRAMYWTVDSGDTYLELPDAELIIKKVSQAHGGIVLMHSFDRDEGAEREDYVALLTELLIKMAIERNIEICTCSSLR